MVETFHIKAVPNIITLHVMPSWVALNDYIFLLFDEQYMILFVFYTFDIQSESHMTREPERYKTNIYNVKIIYVGLLYRIKSVDLIGLTSSGQCCCATLYLNLKQ